MTHFASEYSYLFFILLQDGLNYSFILLCTQCGLRSQCRSSGLSALQQTKQTQPSEATRVFCAMRSVILRTVNKQQERSGGAQAQPASLFTSLFICISNVNHFGEIVFSINEGVFFGRGGRDGRERFWSSSHAIELRRTPGASDTQRLALIPP